MFNKLEIKTSTNLSPHMLMYNKILQMNSMDLLEHVNELSQENPFIELSDLSSKDLKIIRVDGRYSSLNPSDSYKYANNEWNMENFVLINGNQESIHEHLLSQINTLSVSKEMLAIMHYLTYSLDSNGLLYDDIEEISTSKNFPLCKIEEALEILKTLEPVGVYARNLKECLLLQVENLGGDELCEAIINNHLEDLGKKHYNEISKSLGVSDSDVRIACSEILKLNPRPGANFSNNQMPEYVIPDLELVINGSEWHITQIKQNQAHVSLNEYYIELAKTNKDPKLSEYLKFHLDKARKIQQSLELRHSTVLRIANFVVNHQKKFFFSESKELCPLKLSDIADELEMHESTISRAVRGKIMLHNAKAYQLSDFFCNTASKNCSASSDEVMQKISKLIADESPTKPLSDQKIADKLSSEGITIARRTVAKYRDSLGIAPATARKIIQNN